MAMLFLKVNCFPLWYWIEIKSNMSELVNLVSLSQSENFASYARNCCDLFNIEGWLGFLKASSYDP